MLDAFSSRINAIYKFFRSFSLLQTVLKAALFSSTLVGGLQFRSLHKWEAGRPHGLCAINAINHNRNLFPSVQT